MCTIVILRRPDHRWPVLVAANRDEMIHRPWRPPARHWPDRADVVAGLDETGGGTWLGINGTGVAAAVLNRFGTLGPAPGKRSRGELPLEALDHADAIEAARALRHLDGGAYRAFNMVVADNRDAFWLRNTGLGRVDVLPIPQGLSMLTAFDLNDEAADSRIARFLPAFRAAEEPDPDAGDWRAWQDLLATRGEGGERLLTFQRPDGFGTVCSTLLALPAMEAPEAEPVMLFAAGKPGEAPYLPVAP